MIGSQPPNPNPAVSGPQPLAPKNFSGFLKGCLIATGIVLLIIAVVGVPLGMAAWKSSGKWMAAVLEKGKPGFMGDLSPDHTTGQLALTEQVYDAMVKEFADKGMSTWTKHNKSFGVMRAINADNKITPDESLLWITEWYKEMGEPVPEITLPQPAPEQPAPEPYVPPSPRWERPDPDAREYQPPPPDRDPDFPEPEGPARPE